MVLVQETKRYRVETEEEAIATIQKFKDGAGQGGYEVKKSSYTQKTKKVKGEVVDAWYLTDITLAYNQE